MSVGLEAAHEGVPLGVWDEQGRAEGGYTDVFKLICCDCGDHPDLDYRDVSPGLQRIRGPYPLAAGVAAYDTHLRLNHEQARDSRIHAYAGESL